MARARSNNTSLILVGIVFVIVGLIFIIPAIIKSNKINNGDLLNLNEASKSDFKSGEYCEITINYDYGCYAEYVETTNYVFKRTTQKYYLIDAGVDNTYFLGIRVAAGDSDELDNLYYADYDSPKTVTYQGILRKQTGDAEKFYEDLIEDYFEYWASGYLTAEQRAEMESITLPFYLDVISPSSLTGSIVIGIIFVILGIFLIIFDIMKKKKAAGSVTSGAMSGMGNLDPNTFGNYSGNDMSNGNPYNANSYGSDPMNQPRTPYSPGDAAINNAQTNPYQDPFYGQQPTDPTDGSSNGSF